MNCLIARIENYKMYAIGGVGKEQERDPEYIEKHYKNPEHNPDRMSENITLYHDPERDGKSWERYIKDYRQEHGIEGRFNLKGPDKNQTNVATQFMVTTTPDYVKGMSKEEQIAFFQDAFQFLKERYPDYHWVEVTIHLDESTPHMHALALPLYHDKEKDRTIFSTTKTQPGKEHFREFQDHIYKHMSERWYGLERGVRGSDREHLSVQEYKAKMELQKSREDLQKEREDLQKDRESFRGPVPEKTILGGSRYKPQDVEKVVNERNIAYAENERLKSENRGLQDQLSRAAMMYDRLDKENKLYEQDRQETREKLQDPAFLREQLRQVEHGPEHGHGHEHAAPMMQGPAGR